MFQASAKNGPTVKYMSKAAAVKHLYFDSELTSTHTHTYTPIHTLDVALENEQTDI